MKVFNWFARSFFVLLMFLSPLPTHAITVGEIIYPAEEYLECRDLEWFEQVICEAAAKEVNDRLNEANITLSDGDVLLHINPIIEPQNIPTGHSCSHRAWINGNYAKITLKSNGVFDFVSESISRPMIFTVNLPVRAYARVNLKEEWGTRLFGSCDRYASDSYYATFDFVTDAYHRFFLSLEPKLTELEDGNFAITVKPLFKVHSRLLNLDVNFSIHGRNNLWSGFNTYIIALPSLAGNLIEAPFDRNVGDSLEEAFVTYGLDIGQVFISSLLFLDHDVLGTNVLESIVSEEAEDELRGQYTNRVSSLEGRINDQIRTALSLNEDGEATFIVNRALVNTELLAAILPALSLL